MNSHNLGCLNGVFFVSTLGNCVLIHCFLLEFSNLDGVQCCQISHYTCLFSVGILLSSFILGVLSTNNKMSNVKKTNDTFSQSCYVAHQINCVILICLTIFFQIFTSLCEGGMLIWCSYQSHYHAWHAWPSPLSMFDIIFFPVTWSMQFLSHHLYNNCIHLLNTQQLEIFKFRFYHNQVQNP